MISRDISDDEVFSFDISPVANNKEEPINDKTIKNQSSPPKLGTLSEGNEFEEHDLDSISSSISSAEDSLIVKEKETKKLRRVPTRDRSLSFSERSLSESQFTGLFLWFQLIRSVSRSCSPQANLSLPLPDPNARFLRFSPRFARQKSAERAAHQAQTHPHSALHFTPQFPAKLAQQLSIQSILSPRFSQPFTAQFSQ